jgi:predicted GTPase
VQLLVVWWLWLLVVVMIQVLPLTERVVQVEVPARGQAAQPVLVELLAEPELLAQAVPQVLRELVAKVAQAAPVEVVARAVPRAQAELVGLVALPEQVVVLEQAGQVACG